MKDKTIMKDEIQALIDMFLRIIDLYSAIGRKPRDFGTGDLLYSSEIHAITMVGNNSEINVTKLADMMGVTNGAISQTISKLEDKDMVLKSNISSKREVNLKLSAKGLIVYKAQESFKKEIFSSAATLYEKASPENRDLLNKFFLAIIRNMDSRL